MIIDRALLKFGHRNFRFEIIEICERSNIILREQYYIKLLKPAYNIKEAAVLRAG
jgi:group I intron endonuclease